MKEFFKRIVWTFRLHFNLVYCKYCTSSKTKLKFRWFNDLGINSTYIYQCPKCQKRYKFKRKFLTLQEL